MLASLSRHCGIGFVVSLLVVSPTPADDWPQFRGPDRNGKSSETGLLQEWPAAGPPLAWKADGIGSGYSGVSASGDRVYTMGDLEDGQYVFSVARGSGDIVWKTRVGPTHDDKYGGPRATPTIAGGRIYVVTTAGDVVCLDLKSGSESWRRSLPEEFGGFLMKAKGAYDWKWSESPLVDGNKVVVTPGHEKALMVALKRKTGAEIWRTGGSDLGSGKGQDRV